MNFTKNATSSQEECKGTLRILEPAGKDILKNPEHKGLFLQSITLIFKNQYITLRDRIVTIESLRGLPIIVGQHLNVAGFDFDVLRAKRSNELCSSGLITNRTTIHFESMSSCNYLLVEISQELFECDIDGDLGLEKCLKFYKKYLEKCDKFQTCHQTTLVFFARLMFPKLQGINDIYGLMLNDEHNTNEFNGFQINENYEVFKDYIYNLTMPNHM